MTIVLVSKYGKDESFLTMDCPSQSAFGRMLEKVYGRRSFVRAYLIKGNKLVDVYVK